MIYARGIHIHNIYSTYYIYIYIIIIIIIIIISIIIITIIITIKAFMATEEELEYVSRYVRAPA